MESPSKGLSDGIRIYGWDKQWSAKSEKEKMRKIKMMDNLRKRKREGRKASHIPRRAKGEQIDPLKGRKETEGGREG